MHLLWSPNGKKNGLVNGVQLSKCYVCGKHFLGGIRLDNAQLWHEYVEDVTLFTVYKYPHERRKKIIKKMVIQEQAVVSTTICDERTPSFPIFFAII